MKQGLILITSVTSGLVSVRTRPTVYELINEVFEAQEQVNEAQAQLLGTALTLAMGGPAQAHVGTGGGGSQSDLPWGEKKKNGRKGR